MKSGTCLGILLLSILSAGSQMGFAQGPGPVGEFVPIGLQPLFVSSPQGIAQDHHGALWIVAWQSVVLYDGSSYSEVPYDQDSVSLITSWTKKQIHGGRHGVLCISGTADEVLLIYVDSLSTRRMQLPTSPSAAGSAVNISCVFQGSDGRFWIGTAGGMLYALDPWAGSFEIISPDLGLGEFLVTCIAEDPYGRMWVGTDRGDLLLVDSAQLRNPFGLSQSAQWPLSRGISAMVCGRGEELWICGSDRSFGRLNTLSLQFVPLEPVPGTSQALKVDRAAVDSVGSIWLAAGVDGLFEWDVSRGDWKSHFAGPNAQGHWIAGYTKGVMVDQSGCVWVVFRNNIYKLPSEKRIFRSLTGGENWPQDLRGATVNSALIDRDGVLWIAGEGRLVFVRPGGASSRAPDHVPGNPDTPGGLPTCLLERKNGELWIGTTNGIDVLDRTRRSRKPLGAYSTQRGGLGSEIISALYEDRSGMMWIGHMGGADKYDPYTQTFTPLIRWPAHTVGAMGTVAQFIEDEHRNLWVGTAGRGLLRLGMDSGDTCWYYQDSSLTGSLPHNSIQSLCVDERGRLWLGTGSGIAQYDYETDSFRHYIIYQYGHGSGSSPGQRGLIRAGIMGGIVPDNKGNLWLSSHLGGIVRFETATGKQRAFANDETFSVRQGRRHALFRTPDGFIYCGGVGGLVRFHPDQIPDQLPPPQVAIKRVRLFNEPMPAWTYASPDLRFESEQNTITFDFILLDYSAKDRHEFQYQLEGASDEWIHAGRNRSVTFANLASGRYTLRLRGSTNGEDWSTNECLARFTILPPWWETWWFWAGVFVAVASIVYGLYRYRLSKILALELVRVRIADDLHDDIGSELSAIALESDMIARLLSAGSAENRRVQKVAQGVRHVADKLRDAVWIVNPEQDTLGDLVSRMKEVVRTLLEGTTISLTVPDVSKDMSLDMEFKRHVFLMFKETINNIVHHAQATKVTALIEVKDGFLHICVGDNGVGFEPMEDSGGRGLRSMRARAQSLGGALTVTTARGSGTTVCFKAQIPQT